jgi:peptidoglycan/LPS O-acetylase OafA/YrhL
MIGVLLYTVVLLPSEASSLRGDALASLGYVTNWYLIFEDQSYFDTLARPSLLRHLWSLAVEEQFYLLFPPLFALVLGRLRVRYALALVLAGALASAGLMALLYEPGIDTSRIYYGTDTRIAGILVGSATAYLWRFGRFAAAFSPVRARILEVAGFAALAGLLTISLLATETGAFLYLGGFFGVSVLSALLIVAAIHPASRLLSPMLERGSLVWLGTRSYSVYLWHWPVFMVTRPGLDTSMDGPELFAVRVIVTLLLAELSFRVVEAPVRNGGIARVWKSGTRLAQVSASWPDARRLSATGFAGALAVFLAISIAAADPPPPPMGLEAGSLHISSWSEPSTPVPWQRGPRLEPTPSPTTRSTPSPTPAATATPSAEPTASEASPVDVPGTALPTVPPPPAPTAPPLPTMVSGPRVFALGDSVMLGAAGALSETIGNLELDASVSRQVSEGIGILNWRRDHGMLGDVVVVHLGTNGKFTSDQLAEMMGVLVEVPRVVLMTVSVPLEWEGPNNDVIRSASGYPNVVVADWKSIAVTHPEIFGDDGVHVGPSGASQYANLLAPLAAIAE